MIQQFSHYHIKDLSNDFLGQGTFGIVYRAYDGKFSRQVAVKVLRTDPFLPPAQQAKQQDALKRFEREAKVVAALQHYAIVSVYDFGQVTVQGQNYPFMVMRLMTGGSLEKRLQQGALPVEEVVRIVGWVAPALDRVHQQKIIHRDLKPANILFDEDDLPALADFGIVKLTEGTQITNTYATLGTPAYMSPEQTYAEVHRQVPLDGRSDIYAMGAILYEMLTGVRSYHQAMDPLQVMYAHRMEPPPRLDEHRSDLGAAWQAVIDKAMAKKPDERYATASELAAALKRLISPASTPVISPASTPVTTRVVQHTLPVSQTPTFPTPPTQVMLSTQPLVISVPTAADHVQAGNRYFQQKDYDRAIAEYNNALLLDANYVQAYLYRGVVYYMKGEFNKAITDYSQAVPLNPNDPVSYYYRGLAYAKTGQLTQAIDDYDHALRLKPGYTDVTNHRQAAYQALIARVSASYQQGRLDEALADCNQAVRLNPNDPVSYYYRGLAYVKTGQLTQAIDDYHHAVRLKPDFSEATKQYQAAYQALVGRAQTAYQQGQLDQALADYDAALRLNPNDKGLQKLRQQVYDPLLKRAQTAYQQGQLDQALADYDAALRLNPNDKGLQKLRQQVYDALLKRAQTAYQQGQLDQALADYDAALRLNPHDKEAQKLRQQAYDAKPPPLGSERICPKDGMVQVYVPAGTFKMGSAANDRDADDSEKPQHKVHLDAYWIDKTPVTNAMFAKFVAETRYQTEAEKAKDSNTWRSKAGSGRENHPVVYVSWNDANEYAKWAERRLPSEAEWEKAAGGTDGRKWPWGNNPPTDKLCNFNQNVKDTTPVGNYPEGASPYRALDMAGNVWELCRDTFDAGYYAKSPKDMPWNNPCNESPNETKVLRGGSWWSAARYTRVRYRIWYDANYRGNDWGFRCARSHL